MLTFRAWANCAWQWIADIHGRAGTRNFSSSVENYFTSERSERVKYFFQHEKRNFVSPSDHVMSHLVFFWCSWYNKQWQQGWYLTKSSFTIKLQTFFQCFIVTTKLFANLKIYGMKISVFLQFQYNHACTLELASQRLRGCYFHSQDEWTLFSFINLTLSIRGTDYLRLSIKVIPKST